MYIHYHILFYTLKKTEPKKTEVFLVRVAIDLKACLHHWNAVMRISWQILPNLGAESMKVEFLRLSFVYLMIFLELQVLLFVRILQHARLQTHFKYSSIPEMCSSTWGDMVTCFFVIVIVTFETVSSRCEARPWTSFFVCWTRGATLSRCPWLTLTWWFSAVNVSCDSTRQYNGPSTGSEHWQLPLRTAIATSNPSDPGSV